MNDRNPQPAAYITPMEMKRGQTPEHSYLTLCESVDIRRTAKGKGEYMKNGTRAKRKSKRGGKSQWLIPWVTTLLGGCSMLMQNPTALGITAALIGLYALVWGWHHVKES
jgi:hypothetical protein